MKKRLYNRFKNSRIDTDHIVAVVCVILAISVIAVPVAGQIEDTFTDDFEGGDANGWENVETDTAAVVDTFSTEGNYSLYAASQNIPNNPSNPSFEWVSGPTLDLQEQFTISGTLYYDSVDGEGAENVRVGITGEDQTQTGENVYLLFDYGAGETRIGTDIDDTEGESLNNDFKETWVNFEIQSNAENGTINAKVWEEGTSEPSEYQITRSGFEGNAGPFGVNPGFNDQADREIWLDSIQIDGTTVTDPALRLDTGNYLEFGDTQKYTLYDLQGENEIRYDVTENSTVTSGNPSVISVDEDTNELTATEDENVSTRVNITATYEGRNDIQQVTVAEQSIENLDVLPFLGRTGAMFLDRGFQMILVGLLLSVAATRTGGVYAGLGIYQMSLTAGWLIGWVPIGLALVGLFTTLFIGLNIAANIDYTVRR